MIIYQNTKGGFIQDVRNNLIAEKIENAFFEHCIAHNNDAEFRSWSNSMQYMRNVIDDPYISDDCTVAIEYKIPYTSKRIDFLIAGVDDHSTKNIVIIELKQWENSEHTLRPDIVRAYTGGANRNVAHPCYQAYSYAKIIEEANEAVANHQINLYPCAYLHNYKEEFRHNIDSTYYPDAVQAAPLFLSQDTVRLRDFIKKYVHKHSGVDLLMAIENGKLKPSLSLQDTLSAMLRGNAEFCLIDEQKVAYETIFSAVRRILEQNAEEKYTIIVKGGPGTGKSVVAVQLLVNLIKQGFSALYVTKNSAPRNVYFEKLRQDGYRQSYIKNLFVGSGSFVGTKPNTFDCLLADEAHRLQMKSGMYQNLGECQTKEIINAAKVSVFFIDEQQRVTSSDACSIDMIHHYAQELGSRIIEGDDYNLVSQFRCNGSDGFLSFVGSLLELNPRPNNLPELDYDVQIFDSPREMREALRVKNQINNKSRMLAGYCYEWDSKKDAHAVDIKLEDDFSAQWNFSNSNTWAIDSNSFEQVGCIHTSQGLEFDYVGVIIGRDLVYRDGKVQTDYTKRARSDKSLNGIRNNAHAAEADLIIRNTYKTLLTRGQKGCYIYCEDEALRDYVRQQLALIKPTANITPLIETEEQQLIVAEAPEEEKFISMYPVYSIQAACGRFGHYEPVEQLGWMKVDGYTHQNRKRFIVQAVGHSMEPRIHDGDYCLFEVYSGGSREGKIVLAEHLGEVDTDYEGAYSIKVYHSKKVQSSENDEWGHESITLQPLNPRYEPIQILPDNADDFRIVGELIEIINE